MRIDTDFKYYKYDKLTGSKKEVHYLFVDN